MPDNAGNSKDQVIKSVGGGKRRKTPQHMESQVESETSGESVLVLCFVETPETVVFFESSSIKNCVCFETQMNPQTRR